jgi:hypothetical protein
MIIKQTLFYNLKLYNTIKSLSDEQSLKHFVTLLLIVLFTMKLLRLIFEVYEKAIQSQPAFNYKTVELELR